MRFDRNSHLHRCLGFLMAGAISAAFGLGLGVAGVGEPASTYIVLVFATIFFLAILGILA